jgi:hypothetical protein
VYLSLWLGPHRLSKLSGSSRSVVRCAGLLSPREVIDGADAGLQDLQEVAALREQLGDALDLLHRFEGDGEPLRELRKAVMDVVDKIRRRAANAPDAVQAEMGSTSSSMPPSRV